MTLILNVVTYGQRLEVEKVECATERDLCRRAVEEIAKAGHRVEFWVDAGDGSSVRMYNDTVAPRLALIEARRRAVALELLVQDKATSATWTKRYGAAPEDYWATMMQPAEREALLARADRLVLAYEEARP